MTRKLVAFCGRKRSGKSTAERILLKHGFVQGSFIMPGKEMMRALLRHRGVSHEEIQRMIEGDLKEIPSGHLEGHTPRYFLQRLGLEFGRHLIGNDFWINSFKDRMNYIDRSRECNWVVADCRMHNETEWLRDNDFYIIKIVRPWLDKADNHGTESQIDTLFAHQIVTNDFDSADDFEVHMKKVLIKQGILPG